MIRVAVVDDEKVCTDTLTEYLKRYEKQTGEKIAVSAFNQSIDFVSDYRPEYDVIFLDIEMPLLNGLQSAKKIRAMDDVVCIVFVTNMAQYAIKGYEVQAFDFVVKPIKYDAFRLKMKKIVDLVKEKETEEVVINSAGTIMRIKLKDVLYVEVMGHSLVYHIADGKEYTCPGQLSSTEEQLKKHNFSRCNNCYLVNLRRVTSITATDVVVGDVPVQISRRRKKDFMTDLTDFLGGGFTRGIS